MANKRYSQTNSGVPLAALNATDLFSIQRITPDEDHHIPYNVLAALIGAGAIANATINFTAVQTAAQIQALIDAELKNMNGHTLTAQFADGTYTLDTALSFTDFKGGALYIKGNVGESGLHINQAVTLDCSDDPNGIFIRNCDQVFMSNIKVNMVPSASASPSAIYADTVGAIDVTGCYVVNDATVGHGFNINRSKGHIASTYVTQFNDMIFAQVVSDILSNGNNHSGTQPIYGLNSSGSVIYKNGTQPTGTSGDNQGAGGQIF